MDATGNNDYYFNRYNSYNCEVNVILCTNITHYYFQVTDFGLHELRYCAENDFIGEHQYYRGELSLISFFVI